jgi:DNA primase
LNSLDDVKNRIKTRVPLDQLIGESVNLVKRGSSVMACCPFHAEKTPSFHIYPDQHYYCFGCKESGDAITFVRKTRELSFVESLRFLSAKYGIEAPELEESEGVKRRRGEQVTLNQLLVAAQDFFVRELRSDRGVEARHYLSQRGFSQDNIHSFGFGLTPAEGYGLVKHLRAMGFREEQMIAASLAVVSAKSGRPYDFFRDRIMIPIRDAQGRVIAFGGRTTIQDPAKYKNSGATSLFDKSAVLYGLDHARDAIKEKSTAVIVEGYMDALCLWQAGMHQVVASMGTALTVRQLKLLVQQTKVPEVILLFDGDSAGQRATLAAIEVVLEVPELRVKAAKLGGQDDPDTFVRKNGIDALEQILKKSVDLIELCISSKIAGVNSAAIPKIVTTEFVPWLAKIQDPVKKGFLVSRVSGLTGVAAEIIGRQLASFSFGSHRQGWVSRHIESSALPVLGAEVTPRPVAALLPTRPLSPVETGVLGHLFFAEAGEIDCVKVSAFIEKELSLEPLWQRFAEKLLEFHSKEVSPKSDGQWRSGFTSEEDVALEALTSMKSETFLSKDRNRSLERLICEQKRQNIQQAIAVLKRQVQVATSQAPDQVPVFLREVMALTQSLTAIERQLATES